MIFWMKDDVELLSLFRCPRRVNFTWQSSETEISVVAQGIVSSFSNAGLGLLISLEYFKYSLKSTVNSFFNAVLFYCPLRIRKCWDYAFGNAANAPSYNNFPGWSQYSLGCGHFVSPPLHAITLINSLGQLTVLLIQVLSCIPCIKS